MKIDLHVHTTPLSPDSLMNAEQAIETAKGIGLDGICFTEHDRAWQLSDIGLLREKHEFPVFCGVEVMLRGNIEMLVFGLNIDFPKLIELSDLREMVTAAKGFMVYAHPFRGLLESTVNDLDAALKTTLGKVDIACIDAVEGHNGHNKDIYNIPALEMAAKYNLRSTGGSDAHEVDEIGTCITIFQSVINTDAELLNELNAGRFTSANFRAKKRLSWSEVRKP